MRFGIGLLILSVLMIGSSFGGETKLTAGDAHSCSHFGSPIATSGTRLVVGGRCESAGAVFVFELRGGSWIETAKLSVSDGQSDVLFGRSVAVTGNVIVVGDRGDDAGGSYAGAAFVFEFIEGSWVETAKLIASDAYFEDLFGWAVAVSGNVTVIGAPWEDTGGQNAGAAYVSEFSGGSWVQTTKLVGGAFEHFGSSLAMSENMIVVGAAWSDEDGRRFASGAVHVFELSGEASWVETAELRASDASKVDRFAESVAVSGNLIVVGALGSVDEVGAVYVFELPEGGSWNEAAKLTFGDGPEYYSFGESVALAENVIFAGTSNHDGPGAVWAFDGCGNGIVETDLGEECDVGNFVADDDCMDSCKSERFFTPAMLVAVIMSIAGLVAGTLVAVLGNSRPKPEKSQPETGLNPEASNSSPQATSPEADSVGKASLLGEKI